MNGKWFEFKELLIAVVTVVSSLMAAIGISFYAVLMCSGWLLRIPSHFMGVSRNAIMADYYRLIFYLTGFSEKHFKFHYLPMSIRGIRHFSDVHYLVEGGEVVTVFLLVMSAGLFYYEKKRYQLWRLMPLFKQVLFIVIVMVGLFLVSFQDSFLWFHEVVFPNNDWVFDPKTDPVILILDERFFIRYLFFWLSLSMVLLVIILVKIKQLIKLFVSRS